MNDVLELARQYAPYMRGVRRELHQYPELGGEEHRTAELITRELDGMGIEYTTGVAGTGVVGLLRGNNPEGRVLLIRADMDALPLTELTDCPFRSKNPGVMHACGHDAHVASLLGAAKILSGLRDRFSGTVKLCFQPAEECSSGGAQLMVEEGVLENPKVDFAVAMHVEPSLPVGVASIEPGPITAYPETFRLDFHGLGGHGTLSCQCADPILPALEACSMIQNVRTKISALDPCIIQVCMVNGGTAPNVIPESCCVQGTTRTFDPENRQRVRDLLGSIAGHVSQVWGVTCDFSCKGRCSPVINDSHYTQKVREDLRDVFDGGYGKIKDMGGEDFCFFSDNVPGVYMNIGSANGDPGTGNPLHSADFALDEGVMEKGSAAFAKIALSFLNGAYDPPNRA